MQAQVVRSYMHVSGSGPLHGLVDACKTIFREDGVRGFYRGACCAERIKFCCPSA